MVFDNEDMRGRMAEDARKAKDMQHNAANEDLYRMYYAKATKKIDRTEPADEEKKSKYIDVTKSLPPL